MLLKMTDTYTFIVEVFKDFSLIVIPKYSADCCKYTNSDWDAITKKFEEVNVGGWVVS